MTTDDELDAKLARLGERVRQRSDGTRAQLAAMHNGTESALEVAELCRQHFDAKLVYLGPEEGFAHGHPYNFDLRGYGIEPGDAPAPAPSPARVDRRRPGKRKAAPVREWYSPRDRAVGHD